jgi:hypothetical protein
VPSLPLQIFRRAADVVPRIIYKKPLQLDRQKLFEHYQLQDSAIKVVGVGIVGTRCYLSLLLADGADRLFLQVKEARRSVLELPRGKSRCAHQGKRVVEGQRLMQGASNIFLGWARTQHHEGMTALKFGLPATHAASALKLDAHAEREGFFCALHAHAGVAGGLLMPMCDLPDRLGQGVDDDAGFAVAEALDGEVVGLVGVFSGVPKADDDAIVCKV